MTLAEWREFGEALITWGFWAIVYGAIAITVGLSVIAICDKQIIKFFR